MLSLVALQLWTFRRRRAVFYGMLAGALRRNETLSGFLEQQCRPAGPQDKARAQVASRLHALCRAVPTSSLGDLLRRVMPRSDAGMLAAVDSAAVPHAALEALSEAVSVQRRLSQAIFTQVMVPLVLLALCCLLSALLSQMLLSLQESLPPALQVEQSQGLSGWVYFMARHTLDLIVSLLIVALPLSLALAWWLPRWTGPLRLKADALPVFSLYRDARSLRLLMALPVPLQGGQALMPSVEVLTANSDSAWVRWQSRRMQDMLKEQPMLPLAAFNRGLLSPSWFRHVAGLASTVPVFQEVLLRVGTHDVAVLVNSFKARARRTFLPVVLMAALLPLALGVGVLTTSTRVDSHILSFAEASSSSVAAPKQSIPVRP